ncbi:MAG: type I-U CRISPR-associated protein Csb2 [Thermoanaerobaculia bacterium]|nr:type I-U CRISPR-associated protein Csb2 [Thermoanaerobaculia bacterium]
MSRVSAATDTEFTSFSIRVDFLTQPVLADVTGRGRRVEWPPHPHRLFCALTAAHYEAGVGRRETLEWLECQSPPEIATTAAISERSTGTVYVPVNDKITRDSVSGGPPDRPLGDRRKRQERTFAVGSPVPLLSNAVGHSHRSVYYTWRVSESPPRDLDDILFEVTRLGHSSSLVAASLWAGEVPEAAWIPGSSGSREMRVPAPGTLRRLDQAHEIRGLSARERDRREPALPGPSWATYRRADRSAAVLGPWRESWVWALEPRVTVTAWVHLADRIRGALLVALPDGDASEILTGHQRGNHLAVMPLPFVGHRHASGDVLGFAIAVPELDAADRSELLEALAELGEIRAGRLGVFNASRLRFDDSRHSLRMSTWTGPSCYWATVTPIVYDRFPKGNLPAVEIVAESVERLGLPRPAEVITRRDGAVPGTPPSSQFRVRRPGNPYGRRAQRPWSHVVLRFDCPVEGPLLIGASRHFGLGLCKPFDPASMARWRGTRVGASGGEARR